MELRRALMLFAIILALAAIVTSLSRPVERDAGDRPVAESTRPTAGPRPNRLSARVSFSSAKRRVRRLEVGRPAIVTVKAPLAGHVELEGLGLSAPAGPLTPARFDVLATRPGRHQVRFTPAGDGETRSAGTLVVVRPR